MLRAVARQIGGGYAGSFTTLSVNSPTNPNSRPVAFAGVVSVEGGAGLSGFDWRNTTTGNSTFFTNEASDEIRLNVGGSGDFTINTDAALRATFASTGLAVVGNVSATTRIDSPSYTVAGLPAVGVAGGVIFVSNETGGAVLAFSDGTNWRRVTDRAIVA